MNFIISIIRTLFRHRWLILVGTAIFTLLVFYYTRHMQGGYDVKATLYTGVASGYNLESDKRTDWATVQIDGQPDKYHASREHPEKSIPAIICPCTYPGKSGQ